MAKQRVRTTKYKIRKSKQNQRRCPVCGKYKQMLRLEFTRQEVNEIKSKIYLSEMQERIFEYRMKEYSITKMAMLENVSESTINRELKKIRKKIMRII